MRASALKRIPTELRSPLLGGSAHRRRPSAHASFAKSYYCTVLPTIAFYFLPYHHAQHTRSSLGSDRQSGRGSLPHLASLPIPSLGAGRTAVLLAPSTTLATTTMRRCGAPACLHHACACWFRPAIRQRPPCGEWATPQGSARGEGPPRSSHCHGDPAHVPASTNGFLTGTTHGKGTSGEISMSR